jgi:hypothetical protein
MVVIFLNQILKTKNMTANKKQKRYKGFIQTIGAKEIYQICDIKFVGNEIILNTRLQ